MADILILVPNSSIFIWFDSRFSVIQSHFYLHEKNLTCSTVSGMYLASSFSLLKKTRRAEHNADSKLAMMVLVRMATFIDEDLSPITTTGDSNGSLDKKKK